MLKSPVGFIVWLVLEGCPRPAPTTPPHRQDAVDTDPKSPDGDACERAGQRLRTLKCKESRADFAVLCRKLEKNHIPVCPVKLSHITSCDEVKNVCR